MTTEGSKGSGGPLGRMKPWQQIATIVVCLALTALVLRHWLQPAIPNGHIPEDFPNTWIAPQDDGHPDRIVIIPGRSEPPQPVERDGRKLFQAYQCMNERCPGRVDGHPYVFAHWDMRPCPRCNSNDPKLLQRYNTPEGEAMLVEIRRGFAP